jgi:hypothetical protein
MAFYRGPNVVTNGLVLSLDAGNTKSYTSGSTTWYDKSGNGNNGTLTNGPTFDSANGGSIVTNGTNNYINLGQKFQYQDQFTVECWVRWPTTPTQTSVACGILAPIFTNKDYGWNLFTNGSNTISWDIYNTPSAQKLITTSTTYLDQWVHIVGYKNGTSIALYVNGTLVASDTLSTNAVYYQTSYSCTIGGNHPCGSTTYYMALKVGAARIYNKILSEQEIQQNYNALKSRFNLT